MQTAAFHPENRVVKVRISRLDTFLTVFPFSLISLLIMNSFYNEYFLTIIVDQRSSERAWHCNQLLILLEKLNHVAHIYQTQRHFLLCEFRQEPLKAWVEDLTVSITWQETGEDDNVS